MSVNRDLNMRARLEGDDEVLRRLQRIEETGRTSAIALQTGYLAASQVLRDFANVGREVIQFQAENIRMANEESKALAGRNTLLQQSGQYSAEIVRGLDQQVTSLQRNLGISDSYVISLQRQLLAQKLNAEAVDDAVTASLGLSRVMGGDLSDNTRLITRFLGGMSETVRGTTIEVDKHATTQQRLEVLLQASASGMAILGAESKTTAGEGLKVAEAYGEIRQTLGSQIGDSPDMAAALGAVAKALFDTNDELQKMPSIGNLAAQGVLLVAETAYRAAGGVGTLIDNIKMLKRISTTDGTVEEVLFGRYDDSFKDLIDRANTPGPLSQGDQISYDALLEKFGPEGVERMRGYFERRGNANSADFFLRKAEELQAVRRKLENGEMAIPTGPMGPVLPGGFIDSLGGLPERKSTENGMNSYGYPAGFRPQNTELWAAAGEVVGKKAADSFAKNVAESSNPIPDLSAGTTGYSRLDEHPLVQAWVQAESRQRPSPWRDVRGAFDDRAWGMVGASFLSGGFGAAAQQAGSFAGAALLPNLGPLGALLGTVGGGIVGDILGGVGDFFGLGGGGGKKPGASPSYPVYVEDVRNHRLLTTMVNLTQQERLRSGGGIDFITNDYRNQRAGGGLA